MKGWHVAILAAALSWGCSIEGEQRSGAGGEADALAAPAVDTGAAEGSDQGPELALANRDAGVATGEDGGEGVADPGMSEPPDTSSAADPGSKQPDPGAPDPGPPDEGPPQPDIPPEAEEWLSRAACGVEPPEGALLAADPPEYSGGECPALQPGFNTITTSGKERRFMLVMPSEPAPDEVLPVLFMWHWLKSKPESFLEEGEIQAAVDEQRFIGIIPESLYDIYWELPDWSWIPGDIRGKKLELPWPFLTFIPQSRFEEEYLFFDDMLACVSKQHSVDKECVSTVGVSAGGVFTVQLAAARAEHLASFLSLSGGVGGGGWVVNSVVSPWSPPQERKMPAVVLWGGPRDSCITLNFEQASRALEQHLVADGHFFVECIHNCSHGKPPLDPPPGMSEFFSLWDFFLHHPYWLPDGWSPYLVNGFPDEYLPWYAVGAGTAVPRSGECDPAACPF